MQHQTPPSWMADLDFSPPKSTRDPSSLASTGLDSSNPFEDWDPFGAGNLNNTSSSSSSSSASSSGGHQPQQQQIRNGQPKSDPFDVSPTEHFSLQLSVSISYFL